MTHACCTGLSPCYTHDHRTRCRQQLSTLLLHLTGLQAQEIAHLLTLASLHLVFSSASQVIQALIAVFITLAKWGDMEKAGRKRQKAPQKRSKESPTAKWKGAEHIFQKAEIPTSIRTCCLSNKSSWQTQLTSLEKMSVLIKEMGEKKTKGETEESHQKNRSYAKTGGEDKGHLSSPSVEKRCHMTKK